MACRDAGTVIGRAIGAGRGAPTALTVLSSVRRKSSPSAMSRRKTPLGAPSPAVPVGHALSTRSRPTPWRRVALRQPGPSARRNLLVQYHLPRRLRGQPPGPAPTADAPPHRTSVCLDTSIPSQAGLLTAPDPPFILPPSDCAVDLGKCPPGQACVIRALPPKMACPASWWSTVAGDGLELEDGMPPRLPRLSSAPPPAILPAGGRNNPLPYIIRLPFSPGLCAGNRSGR